LPPCPPPTWPRPATPPYTSSLDAEAGKVGSRNGRSFVVDVDHVEQRADRGLIGEFRLEPLRAHHAVEQEALVGVVDAAVFQLPLRHAADGRDEGIEEDVGAVVARARAVDAQLAAAHVARDRAFAPPE
jgi:hypothetical protein